MSTHLTFGNLRRRPAYGLGKRRKPPPTLPSEIFVSDEEGEPPEPRPRAPFVPLAPAGNGRAESPRGKRGAAERFRALPLISHKSSVYPAKMLG